MDETPVADAREPGATAARRSSFAGMFPFLQKHTSMDTDPSDRTRSRGPAGAGGKVWPGKHSFARSSSGGDASLPPDSPSAPRGSGGAVDSPSALWAAAGQQTPTIHQSWPGPASPALPHTTPTRGLFSKLLSKKKATPSSVLGATPLGLHSSPSLGASSGGSPSSPRSSGTEQQQAAGSLQHSSGMCTPPPPLMCAAGGVGDADGGSCYSTPLGSESAAESPSMAAHLGMYGGDTLDLRTAGCDRSLSPSAALPPAAELPDVFTPGFNELLRQAGSSGGDGGRLAEPPTPAGFAAGMEPTVALVTGAELCRAGAGHECAAAALLFGGAEEPEGSTLAAAPSPDADSASDASGGHDAESMPATHSQEQLLLQAIEPERSRLEGSSPTADSVDAVAAAAGGACSTAAVMTPLDDGSVETVTAAASGAAKELPGTTEGPPAAAGEPASLDSCGVTDSMQDGALLAGSIAAEDGAQAAALQAPQAVADPSTPCVDAIATCGSAQAAPSAGNCDSAGGAEAGQLSQPTCDQAVVMGEGRSAMCGGSLEEMAATSSEIQAGAGGGDQPPPLTAVTTTGTGVVCTAELQPADNSTPSSCEASPDEQERHLQGSTAAVTASAESPTTAAVQGEEQAEEQGQLGSPRRAPLPSDPPASDSPAAHDALDDGVPPGSVGRRTRRAPGSVVRESMPLFLADPARAVGSPLSLDPSDDLHTQDMQQLADGSGWRARTAGGRARLLAHGGPQRVAAGGKDTSETGLSSACVAGGWLEPVAEASYSNSGSPIPEESPTAESGGGSGARPSLCPHSAVASGADGSPLQARRLSTGSPCSVEETASRPASSPSLRATPGSAHSTPTLALGPNTDDGQEGAAALQLTPPSATSSSIVGSAIRTIDDGRALRSNSSSPQPCTMAEASPTLMLMPALAGAQGGDTPTLTGGAGGTPSLLDACAASPSAVYATRVTATPFRGALAALPVDAALAAPLVDSSPFSLSDGCGMDTVCLADEAQRVAQNLAAAAASGLAGSRTPGACTPVPGAAPPAATTPLGMGGGAAAAVTVPGSPTEELRDLHVVMLTKQLAELQKRTKDLEGECLRLREQVEIYEFEKTELNSQEEMEKAARQYAEEQLQALQGEVQQLLQARGAAAAQMVAMRGEFEAIQLEAQAQHEALRAQHAALGQSIAQLQAERNEALDRLNLLDMQVTALRSNNADLSAALEAEQGRGGELASVIAARDRELAEAARSQLEAQAKLERAMEQVIAANTAKEHARQKATDEAAKAAALASERQALLAERDRRVAEQAAAKTKYAAKSAALKEAEARLAAKEQENQELMGMCDQLLAQQEGARREE